MRGGAGHLPLGLLLCGAFVYPAQYSESYLGELPAKVRRLDSAGEGKVVVIGGSSVAFGLDSGLLSELLERPVVNFGLYATLGTEVMIELAARSVKSGDIIVIAPETDRQTMSDYFGAEAVLQAFDGEAGMLFRLPVRYTARLAGAFYPYAAGKLAAGSGYSHPASGIYGAASFNEYGDICAPRPYNVMAGGVDGTRTVTLTPDIVSEDFYLVSQFVCRLCVRARSAGVFQLPANEPRGCARRRKHGGQHRGGTYLRRCG